MTDREAIRRLAIALRNLATGSDGALCGMAMSDLLDDLAEPVAPTAELNTARTDWPIVCRHGTSVSCSCEFGRGYDQARRDMTADSLKAVLHPTVTREQADRVKTALAYYFDAKEFGAMGPNWPAFFRAVADALEGK